MVKLEYTDFKKSELLYETEVIIPDPPKKSKIDNYRLPAQNQKFQKVIIPKSIQAFSRMSSNDANREITENAANYIEELEFINRELDRIEFGYWFFCNGKPTYITGHNYFYLNYYRIDVGYPEYRDKDRKFFMVWDNVEVDSDCFGLIYVKPRREGATYRAACINLNTISSGADLHGGIQSKTGKDAKKVFTRCIVQPFRKLPFYLKPITAGTTAPKMSLDFFEPEQKISRKNKAIITHEALDSFIDWESSSEIAYDSQKLHFSHDDEFGKVKDVDIIQRWEVKKECLATGADIIGKSLHTSTIEEISKENLERAIELWNDSDPVVRDDNNRTVSGMRRHFCPAYDGAGGFIDEYGASLIEPNEPTARTAQQKIGAKQFYMNGRDALDKKRNTRGLTNYKRKYPFSIDEALRPSGDDCLFDVEKLSDQLTRLTTEENPFSIKRGYFAWVDGIQFGKVEFRLAKEGKFAVTNYPELGLQNNVINYGDFDNPNCEPRNKLQYCSGADPFDHKQTAVHTRKSKGSGYVFRKFDPLVDGMNDDMDEWTTHQFVCQYIFRPNSPETYYEDMLMMCWFFGCQMLPETNKPGLMKYFERMGCSKFLMHKPKAIKTTGSKAVYKGVASSPLSKNALAARTDDYIYKYCSLVPFVELIKDWLIFDIENTEKYDASMAAGWTLLGAGFKEESKAPKKHKIIPFVKRYDNTGYQSKIIG